MNDENKTDLYWAERVEYHLIGANGANCYTYFMKRMNDAIEACNKIENQKMRNGYMFTIEKKLK